MSEYINLDNWGDDVYRDELSDIELDTLPIPYRQKQSERQIHTKNIKGKVFSAVIEDDIDIDIDIDELHPSTTANIMAESECAIDADKISSEKYLISTPHVENKHSNFGYDHVYSYGDHGYDNSGRRVYEPSFNVYPPEDQHTDNIDTPFSNDNFTTKEFPMCHRSDNITFNLLDGYSVIWLKNGQFICSRNMLKPLFAFFTGFLCISCFMIFPLFISGDNKPLIALVISFSVMIFIATLVICVWMCKSQKNKDVDMF